MKHVSFVLVKPTGVQTVAIWRVTSQKKFTVFALNGVSRNHLRCLSRTVNEMLGRHGHSNFPFKFGDDITVGKDFIFGDDGCYAFTTDCPSVLNIKP